MGEMQRLTADQRKDHRHEQRDTSLVDLLERKTAAGRRVPLGFTEVDSLQNDVLNTSRSQEEKVQVVEKNIQPQLSERRV